MKGWVSSRGAIWGRSGNFKKKGLAGEGRPQATCSWEIGLASVPSLATSASCLPGGE